MCDEFALDKSFLDTLVKALESTLRDLVFYSVGILINITLHAGSRARILERDVISKLIEVLKDSNIEDLDLSKVCAKAIHNVAGESNYWEPEMISKMDTILTDIGDELDSIMVSCIQSNLPRT